MTQLRTVPILLITILTSVLSIFPAESWGAEGGRKSLREILADLGKPVLQKTPEILADAPPILKEIQEAAPAQSPQCKRLLSPEQLLAADEFLNLDFDGPIRADGDPQHLRRLRRKLSAIGHQFTQAPTESSLLTDLGMGQQTGLDQAKIASTLFVFPVNDLESYAAAVILRHAGAPYIWFSESIWGAKLKTEVEAGLLDYVKTLPIQRVAIFEIPGLDEEQSLRELGKEVVLYDHHSYDSEGLERAKPESSLEQLCNDIGWKMSPAERMVATADHSFIPGLKDLGVSVADIFLLRGAEAVIQQNSSSISDYLSNVRYFIGWLKNHIFIYRSSPSPLLQVLAEGRLFFLTPILTKGDAVMAKNVLPALTPNGRVNILQISNTNVSFSGDPRVVDALLRVDWKSQLGIDQFQLYSGGDAKFSRFMTVKISKKEIIPSSAVQKIVQTVEKIVSSLP